MRRPVIVAIIVSLGGAASAHGLQSAYLEVTELDATHAVFRLTANTPLVALVPPPGCVPDQSADTHLMAVSCEGGLGGQSIAVDGLGPIVSDVVVRVRFHDGTVGSRVLTAAEPRWSLPRAGHPAAVLGDYVLMGLGHIASGVDHLLFLAALAIALRRLRAILVAETAFTVAHTLTYTASALGVIRVSSAAAEACIALSLVLLALDAAATRADRPLISTGHAAALAFVFGLVHGLGFAGGLRELGLPEHTIGWALCGFALGVETGQVIFLVACVGVLTLVAHRPWLRRTPTVVVYAVGSAGAFLFFQRLAALVRP